MPILAGFSERGRSTVRKNGTKCAKSSVRKKARGAQAEQAGGACSRFQGLVRKKDGRKDQLKLRKNVVSCNRLLDRLRGTSGRNGIRPNHKPEETEELLT